MRPVRELLDLFAQGRYIEVMSTPPRIETRYVVTVTIDKVTEVHDGYNKNLTNRDTHPFAQVSLGESKRVKDAISNAITILQGIQETSAADPEPVPGPIDLRSRG